MCVDKVRSSNLFSNFFKVTRFEVTKLRLDNFKLIFLTNVTKKPFRFEPCHLEISPKMISNFVIETNLVSSNVAPGLIYELRKTIIFLPFHFLLIY